MTEWIIITVCGSSWNVRPKQSHSPHAPYLCYSSPLSRKWAPYRYTIITYINGSKVDKHPQCTHITHVNSTGLDPFSFAVKDTAHWGERKEKKTGGWGRGGVGGGAFFADEMKSSCCSDLSEQAAGSTVGQATGRFFSLCSLSNYTVWEKEHKERKGVILNSWGENDGCIERDDDFK